MKKIFTLAMALMLSVIGLYAENTACSGTDNACAEGSLEQGYNYNISTNEAGKVYVSFELLDEKVGVVAYIQNWTGGGLINESGLTYSAETKTATGELGGSYAKGDAVTFRVKFAFAGGMAVTRNFDYTVGDNCEGGEGVIVNVEVPTGTPACAFYGQLSNNNFVDMTMVDETHYTITFSDKTAADLGWGYKFCWENGNWATQAAPETTYTATDGSMNVVLGWQTEPGTSYRYTEYTEWKIKHGYDGEWTWEDLIQQGTSSEWWNNFTEESIYWDPSTGGINIGSCDECPIKKDWFTTAEIENGANFGEDDEILIILTVIDDETVTIKFIDPEEVAAVEAEAEAQGATYKVIENGKVIIITPAGKYDILGAPIK